MTSMPAAQHGVKPPRPVKPGKTDLYGRPLSPADRVRVWWHLHPAALTLRSPLGRSSLLWRQPWSAPLGELMERVEGPVGRLLCRYADKHTFVCRGTSWCSRAPGRR
jgi:hypothetical protein